MSRILEKIALLKSYYEDPGKFVNPNTRCEEYGSRVSFEMRPLDEVLGLDHLGSGNYSDVFALSERVVLKVNSKSLDTGYALFADYASRVWQSNPYVPRIYYRGMAGEKPFFIIERLQPYVNDYDFHSEHQWMYRLATIKRLLDDKMIRCECPHIEDLARNIGAQADDIGCRNVMMRGEQLVLTDPCS